MAVIFMLIKNVAPCSASTYIGANDNWQPLNHVHKNLTLSSLEKYKMLVLRPTNPRNLPVMHADIIIRSETYFILKLFLFTC